MSMTLKSRALLSVAAVALASAAFTSQAIAQESDVATIPDATEEASDAETRDTVVVTGSRLRKDAFSSPSPLTTLDVDSGRQIGVSSVTELLSRATVANGTQIDSTLNTNAGNSNATEAPPSGGVGSSNISLRGLGPERTLVLLNGRRLAATGVRGAPSQPDISLIPFSLVDRAEVVTEAGSSIYGADAVAGVVNVILRNDFEGFEITTNVERPEEDGGSQWQVGFIAGAQGDRARIIFGAEYYDRQRISAGQRDFSSSFRDIRVGEDGTRYIIDRDGFFDNVILSGFTSDPLLPQGSLGGPIGGSAGNAPGVYDTRFFVTPGVTDIGIPNFSSCDGLPTPPAGVRDFALQSTAGGRVQCRDNFPYFDAFNDQDERRRSDLVGDLERLSILTSGEVDLDWFGTGNQFYFEAFYFDRQTFAIGTNEQIFPDVPRAIRQLDANGNVVVDGSGNPILVDNPLNPFGDDMAPIFTLDSLPQTRDVELQQFRFVGGMRGGFADGWLQENDWQWDAYFSYDRGTGFVSQPILFEPHLTLATLNVVQNFDGSLSCGIPDPTNQVGAFITQPNCVPIDFTRLDLYVGGPNGEGVFSDEEAAFLIGNRTNRTSIDQYVANGFVSGGLFNSPWGGKITAGFGFEYRKDTINSQNDITGVQGLNAAENPLVEGETIGSRHFTEFFGEVDIPLITDRPGIELLNIDGAVRYTDESNFGSDVTYRARLQYRPNDWVSLSGGYGTSFRAPNLREQFLADQGGGVSGGLDPCISNNIVAALGNVASDSDAGFQNLVGNCVASGVTFTDSDSNGFLDATVLGTAGVTTIPTTSGGNSSLEPETSRTYTVTLSISQPWFEGFDFDIAASYYDIKIKDTVSEPTADLIVSRCFNDLAFPNGTSPFCSLISRPNSGNAVGNIINNINVSFFNIGEVTSRGIDVNTRFGIDLPFAPNSEPVRWTLTSATSYLLEQEIETFDPSDRDDNLGEIGTPKLRVNVGSNFSWGNWSLISEHRRLGAGQQDNTPAFAPHPLLPSADPLNPAGPSNVLVHIVDSHPSVWYHDVALSYTQDNYSISVGVNNLADKAPPLIHNSAGPNRNNAVSSTGFDFFGRSYFLTARVAF